MRSLLAPIVVLPLVLSLPAFAQGAPSADHIINSLRPTGNLVLGGTRGVHPAPSHSTATQQAASPSSENQNSKPLVAPGHQ